MTALDDALTEHEPAPARLRALLHAELELGVQELRRKRSGIPEPVTVAIGPGLLAVAPVPATLRADPQEVEERSWLLVAALVGSLVEAGGRGVQAGDHDGHLLLAAEAGDPELAALAFDEHVARVDRLRARAVVLPAGVLEAHEPLRPPVGEAHPLRIAEAIAALGANPADPLQVAEQEDAVLAALAGPAAAPRPHEDPDPDRRIARRIVQRLAGMGKWGGYHTEFSHLARGFHGNDKQLAEEIGERLIASGLLEEKLSVGQRHVFLNPRRARDVYALIEEGTLPAGLDLRR
ncbi:hypothetical protein [Capillimicrobium parvum]|uniref:Uncharacterized protein n=1 Tax=Capillimicrobium parvum TaxID=2884022 RepID=A0A9E7BZX9_9ACTN|nr:hypothetical protein [Capillimicrobium parvum]UGS35835.1 hypothetical protein DSM104329_02232 [Capillimicrobium parvum]